MGWVRVATPTEIPEGTGREFLVGGQPVAVWNLGGTFHATAARCPHEDAPLCSGRLDAGVITCPMHGWRFDVTSGQGLVPSEGCLQTFDVRAIGDELFLML